MCDFFLLSSLLSFWILKCLRINYCRSNVDVASVLKLFFLLASFRSKVEQRQMHAPIKYRIFRSIACMQSKLWYLMKMMMMRLCRCGATCALRTLCVCVCAHATPISSVSCWFCCAHKNWIYFAFDPVHLPIQIDSQRNACASGWFGLWWWKWYSISLNMRTQVDTRRISTENDIHPSAAVA